MESRYTLGLHEVGNGCFAYLQPDGGWGYSNAGLVVGEGESLLVDTLFDLKLTQQMLILHFSHFTSKFKFYDRSIELMRNFAYIFLN